MSATQKAFEVLKLQEGEERGVSDWFQVNQAMINQFAKLTHDNQFIHLDSEKAKNETDFSGTIAHGFLILAFSSKFASEVLNRNTDKAVLINYGFDKVRFVHPVYCDSLIRGRFFLKRVEVNRPLQLRQVYDLSVEIKNCDKPAIVAEWITLTIFKS